MVRIAMVSLVLGVVCGQWFFTPAVCQGFDQASGPLLFLLMLAVGISVGQSRGVFSKVGQLQFRIFVIPAGVIVGSLLGGVLGGILLEMPLSHSTAVAAGMGWYSLSGVLVGDLAGADMGTVAFLANLFRELLAFLSIPLVARYAGFYTAIAPAGATSEDTTLPMLIRYTNEEVVVLAVFNGVLCSAAVPVLIQLAFGVLGAG